MVQKKLGRPSGKDTFVRPIKVAEKKIQEESPIISKDVPLENILSSGEGTFVHVKIENLLNNKLIMEMDYRTFAHDLIKSTLLGELSIELTHELFSLLERKKALYSF